MKSSADEPPPAIASITLFRKVIPVTSKRSYILCAILAAAFYALNAPFSKLLLQDVAPTMMAAFLYLGAGLGMLILSPLKRRMKLGSSEAHLTRKDMPYIIGMVVLDVAAPILLMLGLATSSAANASLLNNFEIVATSLIAMALFKERISRRLWLAIGLITLSSLLLSIEDSSTFQFSVGSVLILLACVCWGLENNCTRMLSGSDPMETVVIKGFGSGLGSLLVALIIGEAFPALSRLPLILLLGCVAYGLSVYFYVYAQRGLGAASTSAYYAISPFIGVLLSLIIFRELPGLFFFIALPIMIVGVVLVSADQREA